MWKAFQQKKGILILIGGAEDKKDEKTVLKSVLQVTTPQNIVIIPTASSYPREVANGYLDAFRSLGIKNAEAIDIRYEDEADRDEFLEKIEKADLVYFGGGDQVKLVRTLLNTKLFKRIKERFETGNLHIAGTSAGAAAASNPMIFDGDYKGFYKGTINYSQGFGFVDDLTIDTHFMARERIPRLTQFLITGKSTKGIGLDEDTGIILYPDYHCRVIGNGMVTIINSDKVTGSTYELVQSEEPYSVNNVRIGFLAPGTEFSIKRWSILKSNIEHHNVEDAYNSYS